MKLRIERRPLIVGLLLMTLAGCRYSYLAETPLVLSPCPTHRENPRISSAFALVKALEAQKWTILRVSPSADVVEAHYCRKGKACTTISASIDATGSIDVLRIEPTSKISRWHYRTLRRWMRILDTSYHGLRCQQRPLADFAETWELEDPDPG